MSVYNIPIGKDDRLTGHIHSRDDPRSGDEAVGGTGGVEVTTSTPTTFTVVLPSLVTTDISAMVHVGQFGSTDRDEVCH